MWQRIGDDRSVEGLAALVRSGQRRDDHYWHEVISALAELGVPAISELGFVLQSRQFSSETRLWAGLALTRMNHPSAFDLVREGMLNHDDAAADVMMPYLLQSALTEHHDKAWRLEVLLSLHRRHSLSVNLRVHILLALAGFLTDEVFDILCSSLNDSLWLRRAAIVALGRFGSRARAVLQRVYDHPLDGLPATEQQRAAVFATGFPSATFIALIGHIIKRHGLEFVFEVNGLDGIGFAGKLQPDVVYVSWFMLPEMSGLEVAHECKLRIPDVKTILLSAYIPAHHEDKARFQEVGLSRLIAAPAQVKEYHEAFRDLASEPNPAPIRRLALNAMQSLSA